MKWVLRVAALLATIICIILVIGWLLPETHITARSAEFRAPRDSVWNLITDVSSMPGWRSDIERVEILPAFNRQFAWRETSGGGDALTFIRAEARRPSFLRTRILDEGGPFGGEWVHDLQPGKQGGTRLTITELGWVRNPLFRFVSGIVIGHDATMDTYLSALARRLGEAASIEDAAPSKNDSVTPFPH
ncbi:MAG: SRPBCC family protein [Gemmatimonadaceae bacterium]